jgi:predicted acyl esterase
LRICSRPLTPLPCGSYGSWPYRLKGSTCPRSILDQADPDASEQREAAWFDGDRDGIVEYHRYAKNAGSPSASTWVPRGYVVIRVDPRGIGTTPGKVDVFSKQEARDYYDAIQCAAEQPWSDGNVGLYGASYLATVQWNVAALHPPALKAIAPLASDSNAYRDLAYPGGIFMGNYRRYWINDMVMSASGSGECVDLVGGMAAHPRDDEFYRGAGRLSADFSKIDIPVLTAVSQTGMLHARSEFEAFSELSSPAKSCSFSNPRTSHISTRTALPTWRHSSTCTSRGWSRRKSRRPCA